MNPLPTSSVIGILGGGQLGRYLVIASHHLGYRCVVLDPDPDCPAGQVGAELIVSDYDDEQALDQMAAKVAVATYEFENVPVPSVQRIQAHGVEVRPGLKALSVSQNRIQEKTLCLGLGIPTAPFAAVSEYQDLIVALGHIGFPLMVKTATGGYDGKGQRVVRDAQVVESVWNQLGAGTHPLIVEGWVDFAAEVSIVVARARDGEIEYFPLVENQHVEGILDVTVAPAQVGAGIAAKAKEYAGALAAALELVGILAVEFFVTRDGRLLVNEMAPRPHNSGHYTMEACAVSQFEEMIRAVAGLPLANPKLLYPAAMVNLLGDLWQGRSESPAFDKALALSGAHLYLYGKTEPRVGRKMGHLTVIEGSADQAARTALRARRLMVAKDGGDAG